MNFSIPILLYHRVDEEKSMLSTHPAVFRKHMQYLSERGWRSLSLDEFSFYTRSEKKLPSRSFLITFDDGYESLFTSASEILKEFNFTASCFLCTSFLRLPSQPVCMGDVDNSCFLTWEQVRSLQDSGVIEFQSHTHSHQKFANFSFQELAHDLDTSQSFLSTELRLPRTYFSHLAWPWGESTPDWRHVASKCGLRHQYTVSRQSFQNKSDLHDIPRTCYDGATPLNFQAQFWLQVGPLAEVWRSAYPMLRSLRRPAPVLQPTAAPASTIKISPNDLDESVSQPSLISNLQEANH